MKKLFYSTILFMSISMCSFAQKSETPKHRSFDGKKIESQLNLSEEQSQKLKELNKTYRVKADELRKDKELSKEDRQAKMKELMNQRENDLKGFLSEEQVSKIEERKSKKNSQKVRRMQSRAKKKGELRHLPAQKGGGRFEHLPLKGHGYHLSYLNLTDDQKEKLEGINKDYAEKLKALQDDKYKSIENILTPEQKTKLKEALNKKDPRQNRKGFPTHKLGKTTKCSCDKSMENLPEEVKAQLKTLDDNLAKEKQAIMRTRIAPAEQERRVKSLEEQYGKDKRELLKDYCSKDKSDNDSK